MPNICMHEITGGPGDFYQASVMALKSRPSHLYQILCCIPYGLACDFHSTSRSAGQMTDVRHP